MRHCSTLLAAGMLALTARAAQAQRPVITQDSEEPGRTAYQHTLSTQCLPSGFATLDFKSTGPGKRLVITYLSVTTAPLSTSGPVLSFLTYRGGKTGHPITENGEFGTQGPEYIMSLPLLRYSSSDSRFNLSSGKEAVVMYLPEEAFPEVTVSNCQGYVTTAVVGYLVSYP